MKRIFRLEGLDCANCAAKIEHGVRKADGVLNSTVNFITAKMTLEAEDGQAERVMAEAGKIIRKYAPDAEVK